MNAYNWLLSLAVAEAVLILVLSLRLAVVIVNLRAYRDAWFKHLREESRGRVHVTRRIPATAEFTYRQIQDQSYTDAQSTDPGDLP